MKKLKDWWYGELKIDDSSAYLHIYMDRSIWACRIESAFKWAMRNYWNLIFLIIGLLGLWIAL